MKVYRVVWLIVCAAFALVGVSVAFYASPAEMLLMSVASAVVTTSWSVLVVGHEDRTRGSRARRLLGAALVGGTTGGAFVGYAVVFGAGVILLAMALLGTSPYAIRAYGRRLRATAETSGARFDAVVAAFAYTGLGFVPVQRGSELCMLTDEQLCEAWRSSTTALRGGSPHRLKRTVEDRQRYLDELERRNPNGIAVWLACRDTAERDPLVYLVEGWADLPKVDWDELTRGQGA